MNKVLRIYKYFLQTFSIIFLAKNWWIVYAGYFHLIDLSQGYILKLRNGLQFKILHHLDALVLNEIIWGNDYRFKPDASPMTIVDVGANIGAFSIYAANLSPESIVYSFEPSPETFKQLLQNIKLNKIKNIVPVNKAVFSKDTTLKLYENGMSGQKSVYQAKKNTEYEKISAVSLDSFIKKNKIKKIDFLKLDCEGSEYEILGHLSKQTFSIIDRIALEYHELNKSQHRSSLKKVLENNQFKVEVHKHNIEPNIGYMWARRPENYISL